MAAIRTCSVSPSTMRLFSPSRSRGMVASAFRVRSSMARLGPPYEQQQPLYRQQQQSHGPPLQRRSAYRGTNRGVRQSAYG